LGIATLAVGARYAVDAVARLIATQAFGARGALLSAAIFVGFSGILFEILARVNVASAVDTYIAFVAVRILNALLARGASWADAAATINVRLRTVNIAVAAGRHVAGASVR